MENKLQINKLTREKIIELVAFLKDSSQGEIKKFMRENNYSIIMERQLQNALNMEKSNKGATTKYATYKNLELQAQELMLALENEKELFSTSEISDFKDTLRRHTIRLMRYVMVDKLFSENEVKDFFNKLIEISEHTMEYYIDYITKEQEKKNK